MARDLGRTPPETCGHSDEDDRRTKSKTREATVSDASRKQGDSPDVGAGEGRACRKSEKSRSRSRESSDSDEVGERKQRKRGRSRSRHISESDSDGSSSESESDSETGKSVSESEGERRRMKRRRKKKKEWKKRKEKERAEKGKTGPVTNSWGKYGIIRETDMWVVCCGSIIWQKCLAVLRVPSSPCLAGYCISVREVDLT